MQDFHRTNAANWTKMELCYLMHYVLLVRLMHEDVTSALTKAKDEK